MKQEREIKILLNIKDVNERAAIAVIMKTIDLVRNEKVKGETDGFCEDKQKAG